ncbi:MAG: serine O-acetyltransferase, partial [Pseudomonadota bacterium]
MSPPTSTARREPLAAVDPIWEALKTEARAAVAQDPAIGGFLHSAILAHRTLEEAVCYRVARRLDHPDVSAGLIENTFQDVLAAAGDIGLAFRADLAAVYDRDPACTRYMDALIYFKGFHALVAHRFAHWLLTNGRRDFALYLQSQASKTFAVDINPAARVGRGIMLDHGHGIVVGETAVIGDNVSMLHGVTLGGTGKAGGDRHPKVGNNVLIGAGASVLGNIKIGDCSRIGAGSVVVKEVPPGTSL